MKEDTGWLRGVDALENKQQLAVCGNRGNV
jgi:hypothetical protein